MIWRSDLAQAVAEVLKTRRDVERGWRLDTEGDWVAPLAFVAVLAAGYYHDTSRSFMPYILGVDREMHNHP